MVGQPQIQGGNFRLIGHVRGHSTTTWTEFCYFLTPPPLRGQFLYPECGQNQTFLPTPPHLVHVVIEWPLTGSWDPFVVMQIRRKTSSFLPIVKKSHIFWKRDKLWWCPRKLCSDSAQWVVFCFYFWKGLIFEIYRSAIFSVLFKVKLFFNKGS